MKTYQGLSKTKLAKRYGTCDTSAALLKLEASLASAFGSLPVALEAF
ncbi:MAG: hypothetical protein CLLPBCKN_001623 [Chroococcidiopsis cubana SAG 39.79]|nr:hypothetical protein [Chroococcidiopsis cubana]MDZ4872235.1 hypothetical protein [Chroococcidiopsis cubana SAG 39.79]